MRSSTLVFDLETVPDLDAGRRIYGIKGDHEEQFQSLLESLREEGRACSNDFLPLHLQRIVAISMCLRTKSGELLLTSIGNEDGQEGSIISSFFRILENYEPILVSWNGSSFDLPVLNYRSLLHRVSAPFYWDKGQTRDKFRWNNYLSRYHDRHRDVQDILANYQTKAWAKLDEIAIMLGFPGKIGIGGGEVRKAFFSGKIQEIRDYCEIDVANTYLVYLQFLLIKGEISEEDLKEDHGDFRDFLQRSKKPHFQKFCQLWRG